MEGVNVAVLVPRRSDNGRRDELWRFCRAWWEREHPTWEIIEGDDEPGLFNRSRSINTAAARTDADVLVIADGDVIPFEVDEAVKVAGESGRACLAYQYGGYTPLNEAMTDRVLDGYDGRWDTPQGLSRKDQSPDHVSSCVAVPRALWERTGGFDERFEGWGPEDRAFHHSCMVLGGGVARVPGKVIHLWHPFSTERNRRTAEWRAGDAIKRRWWSIVDPATLDREVADRATPDATIVVYVTNGRADCLARAVPSFTEALDGPIVRTVIVDDSGDPHYQAWIRLTFPGIDLVTTPRRGFDAAYQTVWRTVAEYGHPWTFVIEDDFEATRPIDLTAMQAAMNERPELVQMALRRQAWFPAEIEAGGVVEQHPDDYTDTPTHLEHRRFITTNPALWRRSFITHHDWPKGSHSESRFASSVFREPDLVAGYWGQRSDEPWVIHDGERIGSGY